MRKMFNELIETEVLLSILKKEHFPETDMLRNITELELKLQSLNSQMSTILLARTRLYGEQLKQSTVKYNVRICNTFSCLTSQKKNS